MSSSETLRGIEQAIGVSRNADAFSLSVSRPRACSRLVGGARDHELDAELDIASPR
jgi:hypothetical protein